jgi:hypothetical protein
MRREGPDTGMISFVVVCLVILAAVVGFIVWVGADEPGVVHIGSQVSALKKEESALCLQPLLRKPGPEQRYMLAIAEEMIAEGGREPEAGTCGYERLAWLRAH